MIHNQDIFTVMLLTLLLAAATSTALSATTTARLASVEQNLLAQGVPPAYIEQVFADPRAAIYPPPAPAAATARREIDWRQMQINLLKTPSVASGHAFIAAHRTALNAATKQYGVSKEAITAVFRIETNLGSFTGRTPVFNVFLSNTVNASERGWASPAENLASLVAYCYRSNMDCHAIKGSWAGAFGLPQFLPRSLALWGVDGNQDNVVDLFDPEDAIPSTANFLKRHGWRATTKSRLAALARYYGSSLGYPAVTIAYGEALKRK